jgi:Flp pilus assembly protein CpaB
VTQYDFKEALMRGNRKLVTVALLLIVLTALAGAAYLYLDMTRSAAMTEPSNQDVAPEPEPVMTTDIVVAIQTIPSGYRITLGENAIALQPWPNESLPPAGTYYTALADLDGQFARSEIPRGMYVVTDMIGRAGGMMAVSGSAAALFEPEDRVAYAIPFDTQGAIGWAVKPGDRVDVLAALRTEPIYTDFLERGVKQFSYLLSGEEGEVAQSSLFGSFELLPNGQWAAIFPVDAQPAIKPALLVQMTVQDAIVWHVGTWQDSSTVNAGGVSGTNDAETQETQQAAVLPPVPVQRREVELVTLLVTRQDALILKYLHDMGADLDLALRPKGMTGGIIPTQPVWFRYILDKYDLPDTMPDDPVGPVQMRTPLEVLPEPTPALEE